MQLKNQTQPNHSHLLRPGEKIHVIHRRQFDKDARRHFVGEVESYEGGMARASGYVFVVDDLNKHMSVKRPDRRTKLIPISSGAVIVNVIPESADIEQVHYELKDSALHVTDGQSWRIDVKEFGWG
jgi:predicted regulator of Ras-like GTPase activity (Roadblock/LC7/MglB family)